MFLHFPPPTTFGIVKIMNTPSLPKAFAVLVCIYLAGCTGAEAQRTDQQPANAQTVTDDVSAGNKPERETDSESGDQAQTPDKKPADSQTATKKAQIGKNVELETDGDQRRVLVKAVVCLRTGMLEQFMCRAMTKEHESILSADVDAKDIHTALLLAGGEPGSPVKFQPKYTPANGSVIKVFVQYEEKGKLIKVAAQKWVKNFKTRKELTYDWVFGGSYLARNGFDPKAAPVYAANDGDVICLANFDSAMMDLPIASSASDADLDFEAFSERIPPVDTHVLVILEPVVPAKKK